MSTEIAKLSPEDRNILLKAPAVVAILAAISDDGEVSKNEKAEAVKLAHLRTYTSKPLLHNYYQKVDEHFEEYFDEIMAGLPSAWEEKEAYLEGMIAELNTVLPKVDKVYAETLVLSLKTFAKHVFKSNSSFLENFILPMFMTKMDKEGFDPKIG